MAPSVVTDSAIAGTPPVSYSRDAIPNDQQLPAYTLTGLRRAFFMAIYVTAVVVSFGGIAFSLFVNPLLAVFGVVTAYLVNNYAFSITHVRYHSSFIELPESKMEVLLHTSFIHHYRDTEAYHKTWLESRVSYFVDPKDGIFSSIFLAMVPATLIISAFLYTYSPVLGVTYLSTIWAAQLLQGSIHEWYHYPKRRRLEYFHPATHYFFTFLEKVRIADGKRHSYHHRHQLHNLQDVELWLDLAIPWGDKLPTYLWKKVLKLYRPGEIRMVPAISILIYFTYVFLHSLLTFGYIQLFA